MYKNLIFAVLLLLIGVNYALWISMSPEYMPGETITFSIDGAQGVLIVDVLDEEGTNVFHEVRTIEREEKEEYYYYYSYETYELELPFGDYTVIAKDGEKEENAEFRVSSVGLMAVLGPEGKGMFLHKEDGSPVEGGRILLTYNKSGETEVLDTVSGVGGIFSFETEGLENIRGEYKGESAEIEMYQNYYPEPYWRDYERHTSYVFSDKKLYQPGETVHISSIIFKQNETTYETVLGSFTVEVRDSNYDTVYSKPIGSVNSRVTVDFPIDEEAPLGWYSVNIMNGDNYAGWYNFEVQEYNRPEIDVSLKPREEVFVVNETIYVDVNTDYYFGGAADAEVKFEIYRSPHYVPYYRAYYCICPWWSEELVAEGIVYTQNGVGTIEWNGTNVTGDYRIEVSVTDESEIISEEETTVSVLEKINLNVLVPDMEANKSGTITILAYDEHDETLEVSGNVKIYLGEDYYYYVDYTQKENESAVPVFEADFSTVDGAYSFEFTPEEYGSYYIMVEADGASIKQYFYVSEWSWWNWNYLDVQLDKDEYSEGEGIEATVTSPIGGKLIVVSMGSEPLIEFFEVKSGINSIVLEADETSNLQLYVIEDGSKYGGYENYMVRGDNWIQVEIDHESVYGPKDIARLVINAEKAGSRSNAAASIAIVDQAIIDLSGADWNDIYKYFYGYPQESYQVRFSWEDTYYWRGGMMDGGLVYAEAGIPVPETANGEAVEKGKEEIEVREKFIETALWIPYIILENGKKEVLWHIPDTLTTWNITVVANEGTNVGMGTSSVLVTKDVIGRMSPPVGLVVDDAAAIPVSIFNYGEERKTFKVTLESSENIWVLGSPIRYVSLESGESHSMYIPVKAIERGEGELTLWVEGGEGDAVKLPLEVKALGVEITHGESGVVESDSGKFEYESPEDAEVTLALHSSILSSAFESMNYLVTYPYGCIEQTMSGFLPDVVLVYTLQELDMGYTGEENLTELIEDGLERIYQHQNSDGSWGWFSGRDARITAYVMDGLTIARKAGVEVEDTVYDSGFGALKGAESSYALFVLNRIDSSLVKKYGNDSFGALTECDDGKCERLILMLECAGSYCSLEYSAERSWYHSETELTSYAVETFVKNGDIENAQKCVNWLMIHKTGRYWRSTKDTARTVLALTEYAKATGELRSDYVVTVYVDEKEVYEERMGYKNVGSEEITLPAGKHDVRIERDGFGPLYYTVTQVYWSEEIPEGEIKIVREFGQTVAKVGDEIEVTLTVNGSGEYVAIEDPIPMGTEIVQEGNRYWWYYGGYRMEARQDKAVFFFDRLEDTEITYKLRVTHKGDFTALPTHAYNMYAPEVGGYSDFEHFTFYEKAYVEPYVTEYNTTLKVWWDGPEPALLRVTVDGVESEYTVQPGENEVVVGPGEVSYSFESDEEYFEGDVEEVEEETPEEEPEGGMGDPFVLAGVIVVVAAVMIYLWKK